MNKIEIPPWSEVETAYITGIVDGEGSIAVHTRGDGKNRRLIVVQMISVVNTNREIIEWLAVMFGNQKGERFRQLGGQPQNRKPQYETRSYGKKAYLIVLRLQPYLRIKRKQAENLIRYHKFRESVGYRNGMHPLSEREWASIFEYVLQSRVLNARGSKSIG